MQTQMLVEYAKGPLAIGTRTPRFSWEVPLEGRGRKQTAYQLLVATTEALLAPGKADLWDSGKVASALLDDGELRRHLSRDIYIPPAQQDGLGKLEAALAKIMEARPVGEKMKAEARLGSLRPVEGQTLAEAALAAGVIVDSEYELWIEAEAVRDEIIQVDAFDAQTYAAMKG